MTTGNISSVSDVSNLVTLKGNVSSIADTNGLSFASLISTVSGGNENSKQGTDARSVNVSNDITDVLTKDAGSKRVVSKNKTDETHENTQAADDSIKDAYNDIREAVKEDLGITDEELDAALAVLGMTVADLVVPQNAAMLVAQVNDTDVTGILTDETLAGQLNSLTQDIADVVKVVGEDTNIPVEEFKGALKEYESTLDKTSDAELADEPETVVIDQDDLTPKQDKTVKVTVENHQESITDDVKEQTQTVNVTEQTSDETDNRGTSGQHESAKEFAQSIVQNLNQSVNEAVASSEISEPFGVDRTDIIEQMLDAVRVNVTPETSSMEIQLTPEHLGKINLNVATRNGIITATITAQNESVRAAIENQVVQLKESMNNQGLKVEHVEVTVASHEFNMNYDNNGDSQNMGNGHKNNSSRRFRTEEELTMDDNNAVEETERRLMEANGNSVSYMA